MSVQIHEDSNIGLTMGDVDVREVTATSFEPAIHYWIATAPIASIFGSEAHGQLSGIGSTREQALERLKEEQRKLAESLWA